MSSKVYMNGKFVPAEEAKVSVFDHGLLYGDGVFEGIRSYKGRVFKLREHLERLYRSACSINLRIPMELAEMGEAVLETLRVNGLRDGYVRLVVTRGVGDLGLDPRRCRRATIFIIADRIALYGAGLHRTGLSLITATTRRNIPEALDPRVKSLNYLNNIMAKIEAINAKVPEALMLNAEGYVAECSGDNIFILKERGLITPPARAGLLEGVTRAVVMTLAKRLKIEAFVENVTRYDVYNARECFLTGTAAEIIPVVRLDGRAIGEGKPGRVTRRLMREFRQLTATEGVPVYARKPRRPAHRQKGHGK